MGRTTDEDAWTERREPWVRRKDDPRSPYACDLERVLHSHSFRSLQRKTQVLSPDRPGLHRTRLTHSLEVAELAVQVMHQVAGDIEMGELDEDLRRCLAHLPPSDLLRTIAMAHDLGHPPFGHDGEKALNACMAPYGGFEANAQTLRILARLESSSASAGANLTRRALLGVLKYPVSASRLGKASDGPRKAHYECEQDVVDWILAPLSQRDRDGFTRVEILEGGRRRTPHRSLDCSIMDVADDIAYGVHDLEDAIAAGLVDQAAFRRHVPVDVCAEHIERLRRGYGQDGGEAGYDQMTGMLFGEHGERRRASSRIETSLLVAATVGAVEGFDEALLRYRVGLAPGARRLLDALHALVRETVIRGPEGAEAAARNVAKVTSRFESAMRESLCPGGGAHATEADRARSVCDLQASLCE